MVHINILNLIFSVFGSRAVGQHHRARVGSGARGNDSGRETGAPHQVQTEGESADENSSRRPCGEILRTQTRTGDKNDFLILELKFSKIYLSL